jgi:amicoumacin kinase
MNPVPEDILSSLAAAFGTAIPSLTYLGGGREDSDGIAYTYPHGDESHVLKIMAMRSDDPDNLLRLEERLKFMHFMGQRGLQVVHPLALPAGDLYATQPDGSLLYLAYTYRKVEGETARGVKWSDDMLQAWGRTVGALHRHTQDYPTWQHSPTGEGRTLLGWREEWQGFYEWCKDEAVKARWESIRDRLEALPVHRACFGFIHNDPHAENILVTPSGIVLLDFDVANYHWFATDISIALQTVLFAASGGMERPVTDPAPMRHFLEIFMQGYAQENTLDPFWLAQLDLFIAYRRILLFTVLQEWLATEPEKHAQWKQMILDEPPVVG